MRHRPRTIISRPPPPKPPAQLIREQEASFAMWLDMTQRSLNSRLTHLSKSTLCFEWATDPWPGYQVFRVIGADRGKIGQPLSADELTGYLKGFAAALDVWAGAR